MNCLDLLSESPKLFIFKQSTNKTNFGGVLFFLDILVMVIISLFYIINYAINNKYMYESSNFYYEMTEPENTKLNQNNKYNPYLNVSISFYSDDINNKFAIYDEMEYKFIENNDESRFLTRGRANKIYISIYYKCGKDKTCSSFENFTHSDDQTYLFIEYPFYRINHSEYIPVKLDENKSNNISEIINLISVANYDWILDWEVIKYQDKKSLFDIFTDWQTEFIFGHIKSNTKNYDQPGYTIKEVYDKGESGYYIELLRIRTFNRHRQYLLYNRTKNDEILDVIANIGALFSTIKCIFSFVFNFYSKNFDNYKIIEKIIKYPETKNI